MLNPFRGWASQFGKTVTAGMESVGPTAIGLGAGGGAVFGLATSNEGSGPLKNSIFWAGMGTATALTVGTAMPHLRTNIQNTRQALNFLYRAPTDWSGPGYEAWRASVEKHAPPALRQRLLGMHQEKLTTPALNLARGQAPTKSDLINRIMGLAKSDLGIGTGAQVGAVTDVPYWMRLSMVVADEETTLRELAQGPFSLNKKGRPPETRLLEEAMAPFKKWSVVTEKLEQSDTPYLERVLQRARQYQEAGISGLVGPEQFGVNLRDAGRPLMGRDKAIAMLRKQGRGDIADMLRDTRGIDVGVWTRGRGKARVATSVLVGAEGMHESQYLQIPLVKEGMFTTGPAQKNKYQLRKQVFVDDLLESVSQMAEGPVKPVQAIAGDVWAAKMVHKYMPKARQMGIESEFLTWVNETVERSATWDVSAWRGDRRGLAPNKAMSMLRTNQAMVNLPQSVPLQRLLGMPTDQFQLVDPVMGHFTDDRIHKVMKASGYLQMGSENAARNAVFDSAKNLARHSFAAWETPINKPARFSRDFGKPYNVLATGKAAGLAWIPAGTRAERNLLRGNMPLAAQFHGMFDEEIELLRDVLMMVEDPHVKPLSPFFTEMARADQREMVQSIMTKYGNTRQLRKDLRTLADVHEGIFAAAIHKDAMMQNMKPVALSHLNQALLPEHIRGALNSGKKLSLEDLRSGLVGMEIDRATFYGFDRNTRGAVAGTYQGKIRGQMRILDVAIDQGQFVLQTEELYPMAYAKIGTHAIKGEARIPISSRSANKFLEMLRFFRSDKRFSKLYGADPVLPLPVAAPQTVTAFAPFQSLRKIQGVTETTLGTIATTYLPSMSKAGRARALKMLRGSGIAVSKRGQVFQATFADVKNPLAGRGAEKMRAQQGAVKTLAHEIITTPEMYFAKGASALGLGGDFSQLKNVTPDEALAMVNMRAITTTLQPWNTMITNIPKQAGLTMHELMFMKRHGMVRTYEELVQRRARFGVEATTGGFFDALTRMAEAGRMEGTAVENVLGPGRVFSAAEAAEISRRPKTGLNMRTLEKYRDNFIVDLAVAENFKESAALKMRQFMGDTKVLVPGMATDLYGRPFLTETGRFIDPEQFLNPLKDMMDQVRIFQETGDQMALSRAANFKRQYLGKLYGAISAYTAGRASITPDPMAWTAGIVDYRSYRRQYRRTLGDDIASRIVGLAPERWESLRRQGAVVREKGGVKFLMGITKRYPITSADPAIFVADPILARRSGPDAIAVDEIHRYVKQMDWDGDTLYAHLVKDGASADELMRAVTTKQGSYRRFLHLAKYMGGAQEEMTEMVKRRAAGLISEGVVDAFTQRVGKMGALSDVAVADMMSKYFTSQVGRYSNLSKALAASVDAIDDTTDRRLMRFFLADQLQQLAIEFGKQAERFGSSFDPGALAKVMERAMATAMAGGAENIEQANKAMRRVFEDINLVAEQKERMAAFSAAERKNIEEVFEQVTRGFFTGMDPERARRSVDMLKAAQAKEMTVLSKRTAAEAENAFLTNVRALAEGAELDTGIPVMGKMAGKSRQAIGHMNKAMKYMGEMKRGLGDIVKGVRGTPGWRAAKAIGGAALVGAGIIGAMTPAVELDTGVSSSAHRGVQRAPDVGMVGASGEAPMPGSRGGHVASRKGARYVPRSQTPAMMNSRRFYYDQTNRVPNMTIYNTGDPLSGAQRYAEAESAMKMSLGAGGRSSVNVNYSPNARRMSQYEMNDRVRADMLGEF